MQSIMAAWGGYWAGIGVELGIIVLAGVVLALILTGVLFKWIKAIKEKSAERKAEKERQAAEREEERQRQIEADEAAADEAAAELAASEEEPAAEEEPVEESEPVAEEEEESEHEVEEESVHETQSEGVVFSESKTITELYEELSAEQKSYFDELREEALTKPNSELSISRNFITVKIGKRNMIKLLIKRGVTVAEFMLENEQLRQLRLSNKNKRGKSTIKVKPTVVQVLDLPSLKIAIDMINLSYEEIVLDD